MSKVYCDRPFTMIATDSYGFYRPCCFAVMNNPYMENVYGKDANVPVHSIKDVSLMEWYNSPEMVQLRKDMLSGEVTPLMEDICRRCVFAEKNGTQSPRKPKDLNLSSRHLQVKVKIFGNKCNLKCYMCIIHDSSSRIHQTEQMMAIDPEIGKYLDYDLLPDVSKNGGTDFERSNPEVFEKSIQDIVDNIDSIKTISIIGGEPFIIPSHYKLLDAIIETGQSKEIILKYSSNLTKLHFGGHFVGDYFKHFKWVDIRWSMEAVGEKNDYIRFPSNWNDNVKNAFTLEEYDNVQVTPLTTRSALSILNLHETLEWVKSSGFKRHLFNDLYKPDVCRIDYLHPKIREKLLPDHVGAEQEYFLSVEVDDWEERWNKLLNYLSVLDQVNGTDYKKVFPILADDTL